MPDMLSVAEARRPEAVGREVVVEGWIRTRRDSKAGLSFLELNDGSSLRELAGRGRGRPGELRIGNPPALARLQRAGRRGGEGLAGQGSGHGGPCPRSDGLRHGRHGELSLAEEGPFVRVSADHRPSAAADQHVRRHGAGAELRLELDPSVFPGARLPLRTHRRSSPPAIARAPAPCSRSPPWTWRRCRKSRRQMVRKRRRASISRSTSSTGRPI